MPSKLFAPSELIGKLICSICQLYLSVFPIYVKNNGEMPICGRCKIPNEDEYLRDEAYEGLAQYLLFPCSETKNGCSEQLTPFKLKDHETCCTFRKLKCPAKNFSRCNWQGPNKDLLQHFEVSHDSLVLVDRKFELNFINSVKESLLIPFDNEVFILKKEIDCRHGTFVCSVQHVIQHESPENYKYFVRVETGSSTYYHKFPERSTAANWEERTKFTVEEVREKLHDPPVIVAVIEIVKITALEEPLIMQAEVKNPEVDWESLRILECPVCFDYVLPPIFQCLNGHSICFMCKPKLNDCPLCRGQIGTTQNFALEKVVERMIYPCKYHKMGCYVALKSGEVRRHEGSCEYGPYDCPMEELENCRARYNKNEIISHMESVHNNYILKTDRVNIPFGSGDQLINRLFVIKYANRLFKTCFEYRNNEFYWALQLIGPAEECKKFRFELDIIDNSDKKLRQYARGLCVPVTKVAEHFTKKGSYIKFSRDQIDDFIDENLSYRVRVVKD
ncbi:uncharacterized protein [Euwallacea fornicatus]|uniref:uncharacterized protein n=1 Tax=Euwallacea fornicatus TaxID=995702 RepID=UPI00338D6173